MSERAERIRIGISACLAGQAVRYDGAHKHQPALEAHLAGLAQLEGFCPEVEAGLGVPRPPVKLILTAGGEVQARGVEDGDLDVTAALQKTAAAFVHTRLAALSGFILKSRSPSCGLGSTPLHDRNDSRVGSGSGLFARTIAAAEPGLPMAEAELLLNEGQCYRFLSACALRADALRGQEDYADLRQLLEREFGLEANNMPQPWWRSGEENQKTRAALDERLINYWRSRQGRRD